MLRSNRARLLLVAVVILAAAQFARPAALRPQLIDPSRSIHATLRVPAQVDSLLRASCYDCHSDQTRWPWYGRVAPVSWWLANDVRRGTAEMNFSRWVDSTAGARQPWQNLGGSCYDVRVGRMPPRAYRVLHPRATLTAAEIAMLCEWFTSTRDSIKLANGIP